MLMALMLAAAEPKLLSPAGPWRVDTDELGCRASRIYEGEHPTVVGLETRVSTRDVILLVAADKRSLPDAVGEIIVGIGSDRPLRLHYGSFPVTDPAERLVKLFPDTPALDALASAPQWTVGDIRLRVSAVPAALRALRTCTAAILAAWKLDPQPYLDGQLPTIAGNPAAMVGGDNYPADALLRRVQGKVVTLLLTTPGGRVSDCRVLKSVDPSLDRATCASLRNIRFKPPVDKAGKPLASYYIMPVNWQLP